MDQAPNDKIRRRMMEAGYSKSDVSRGILYAYEVGFETGAEAFSLAMSRVLYSDEQLKDGARFAVEPGEW